MKHARLHLIILLVSCFSVTNSCSQTNATGNRAVTRIFVGSTPCDSQIKSILQIPVTEKCEFIKWDVMLMKPSLDTFRLTALYGESQPNTNGFIGGGKKISITGKYLIKQSKHLSPSMKVYSLHGEGLSPSLLLIELDSNILHFADGRNNLIVGNGGWGYVLNRVQ